MRAPAINDYVRLIRDFPELALARGDVGVVRSQWFAPEIAYEVEFHHVGLDEPTRALLMADQIRVEDGPIFDKRAVGAYVEV